MSRDDGVPVLVSPVSRIEIQERCQRPSERELTSTHARIHRVLGLYKAGRGSKE